jgi:hypothetical protein
MPPPRSIHGMLPPELITQIVDVHHGDTPSLKACSLVNSVWTPASQRNLFYRLTISRTKHWHALPVLLEQSPHIRPYIVSLIVMRSYDPAYIPPPHLPLKYGEVPWSILPRVLLPEVRTLSFKATTPVSWLMSELPALQTISLRGAPGLVMKYAPKDLCNARNIQLQTLDLKHCELPISFCEWLGATGSSRSLHTLHLRQSHRKVSSAIPHLLSRYKGIRVLSIRVHQVLTGSAPPAFSK